MPKQRNSPDPITFKEEIARDPVSGAQYRRIVPKGISNETILGSITNPVEVEKHRQRQSDFYYPSEQEIHRKEVLTGKSAVTISDVKKIKMAPKITIDGVDYKLKKGTSDYYPVVKKKK